MNIFGTIIFIFLAGVAGIFIILGVTSDVVVMQTEGTTLEGTTYDEYQGSREECAEMGYYYDEYGEEYEECKTYRTVTYYVCSVDMDFNYTLADEPEGEIYQGEDKLQWGESSGSCLESIKNQYPVNGTVTLYYLSDDVTDATLDKPLEPSGLYLCCGICFAVLALPAGIFMLTNRSKNAGPKTGGMLGNFGPQRVSMAPPVNYQHQGQAAYNPSAQPPNTNGVNAGHSGGGGFGGGGGMLMAGGMGVGAGATYGAPSQQAPQRGGTFGGRSQRRSTKSRNAHSPSRIDGYKKVMAKLNMSKGVENVYDGENMLRSSGFMTAQAANKFMAHSYVLKTLGLAGGAGAAAGAGAAVVAQQGNMLNRNVPNPSDPSTGLRPAGNSDDRLQKMQEEAAAFFESAKPKVATSTTSSRPVGQDEEGVCAHPTCSTEVSAFDFRCFDCRRRFCSAHKGMTFQCESCASN
jgi:hypothetical protein